MRPFGLLLSVLALALALGVLLASAGDGRGARPAGVAAPHARLALPPPRPEQAAEAERTGFPAEVTNDLGMRFRLVPAGSFEMGSRPGQPGSGADEAAHPVRQRAPYYLQTTEVTNAQFRAFRPDHHSGSPAVDGGVLDGDDQPVVGVTHEDAVRFAAWLETRDPRFRYRLPTEAEWEYACRLGGERSAGCSEPAPGARAVLALPDGARRATAPVGSVPANAWGLLDLHGNVAEWCHDRYGPYPDWPQDNPQGATTGDEHVARGGSWRDGPEQARAAARHHHPEGHASDAIGFRLATSLGYARTDYGCHAVLVTTIDPTALPGEPRERPGYALRMLDTIDRLTDRQNDPSAKPRWVDVDGRSPLTIHLAPGRYYVYAWRMDGERFVRGLEIKFEVPGAKAVDVPIPRSDQIAPQ